LGRRFETVLDCGLFHAFDGDERPGDPISPKDKLATVFDEPSRGVMATRSDPHASSVQGISNADSSVPTITFATSPTPGSAQSASR